MNRKNRFIDTEQWRSSRHFTELVSWAQLLHIYMYLDRADFAGIAYLDLVAARHYTKLGNQIPDDMEEIAKALDRFWVHCGNGIFIHKEFLVKTQAKRINLGNPPHGAIIKDMAYWHNEGFEDVFVEVMKVNKYVRFVPLQECYESLVGSLTEAEAKDPKKRKSAIEGAKGRIKNFEDVLIYLETICPLNSRKEFELHERVAKQFGLSYEAVPALEDKVEEQSHEEEDDPLRPGRHPDQSKPILSNISQSNHEAKLNLNYYMKNDGDYAEPLNSFKDEEAKLEEDDYNF